MSRRTHLTVVAALAMLLAFIGLAPTASAETPGWAEWGELDGTVGNYSTTMQLPAEGFPQATMTSDSRGGVGIISGNSTWLGESTPPGDKYGSSRGNQYINLRPRADGAGSPSTTAYTFDRPTPGMGWAFVLGDIDADQVTVTAKGPDGQELTADELGFQDEFNYCDGAGTPSCDSNGGDLPTWDPATQTLTGNDTAIDTEGASGWFEPTVPIKTLTITFDWRQGFPVYQTWFASLARDIAGTVTHRTETIDPEPIGGVGLTLYDPNGNEVGTTTTADDGTYSFPGYTAADGYTVEVTPPEGSTMDETAGEAGERQRAANLGDEDDLDVDFALREIVPVHVSGTVTNTEGDPVPGATVTLSNGDSAVPDSQGYFEFDRVEPGIYDWEIDVPDGYEDVPVTQPDPLEVPEDSEDPIEDQDFVLEELPSLSGQVTAGGSGVGNATITITGPDGEEQSTITDADGNYTFEQLPPGDYEVAVEPPPGYEVDGPDTLNPTVAGEDVENVDYELFKPGALGGQVTDENGDPVPGATIVVDGPDGPDELTTDDEGNYFIDELPPGDYTIEITAVPDGYELGEHTPQETTITAAGETELDHDFRVAQAEEPEEPGDDPDDGPGEEPDEEESPGTGAGEDELPDTGASPALIGLVAVGFLAAGLALRLRSVTR